MPITRRHLLAAIPALPAMASLPGCASGPTCGIEPLGTVQLVFDQGSLMVPVKLEGIRARMLIDTGSERTTMDPFVAGLLKLPDNPTHLTRLTGVGGATEVRRDVVLPELSIGEATFNAVSLAPVDSPPIKGPPISGLLGSDLLLPLDLDFDFIGGTLALYAPGGCGGEPVMWSQPAMRVPLERSGRLAIVRAVLDNTEISAVIDTGANGSIVLAEGADRLGLRPGSLAGDPSTTGHGVGGKPVAIHRHRFQSFRVGELAINAPILSVSDSRLPGIDMLIGLDILRQQRMWLSHTAGAVFFQRTGPAFTRRV